MSYKEKQKGFRRKEKKIKQLELVFSCSNAGYGLGDNTSIIFSQIVRRMFTGKKVL